MKNLHTFEEFLNESLNENAKDEIVFSIDDDKLDQMLNSKFSRQLDYKDDKGDSFYVLTRKDFDRFIDLADSSGFDVDYENSEDSVIAVQESLKENMNESSAYNDVVNILKDLHGFSDKIRFSTEDVNRVWNIVYDDPKGLTDECLAKLRDRKFWNTDYAPSIGKFANGRVNLHFEKSVQDYLDIENFDDKNWSPK
jgi:hypothetical protein